MAVDWEALCKCGHRVGQHYDPLSGCMVGGCACAAFWPLSPPSAEAAKPVEAKPSTTEPAAPPSLVDMWGLRAPYSRPSLALDEQGRIKFEAPEVESWRGLSPRARELAIITLEDAAVARERHRSTVPSKSIAEEVDSEAAVAFRAAVDVLRAAVAIMGGK